MPGREVVSQGRHPASAWNTGAMQLAELVEVSAAVAATRSRREKTALLADLLGRADPDELAVVVGLLTAEPRQGRVGVGWATVAATEPSESDPELAGLTVGEVDQLLTDLAHTAGPGSQGRREQLLADALGRTGPAEADFLRRLLLGELRQGANAGVVTDAAAAAADVSAAALRRAVMLSGDLGGAATTARTMGRVGLDAIGLEVGRPIQPMLASTADDVAAAVTDLGTASVEWKLDGVRIQAHRDGDRVGIWTRNLNDATDRLPETVELVRSLPADRLVLDGEVLGIDDDGRPAAFQDTVSVEGSVAPFFFDVLHVDGRDLLDAPLVDRIAVLAEVAGSSKVPGVVTSDGERGERVLAEALARGHEGVVVKAADSPYQAGRRGKAWRKVKPVHTLDLVVLAVEHGSGRRSGWLSNIHLGARAVDGDGFVMVGKTFKGMTDEMLAWQTERFRELATHETGHVVHVRPEQVVEIALDGVQRSSRYPGGVALRFARVRGYRDDKAASEIDTLDTVRAMLG